jgi:hypothetical protein
MVIVLIGGRGVGLVVTAAAAGATAGFGVGVGGFVVMLEIELLWGGVLLAL